MGIAAQNLGLSNPLWTLLASLGFGIITALSNILQTINAPAEIIQALPYVATLLGLVLFALPSRTSKTKGISIRQENSNQLDKEIRDDSGKS